MFYNVLARQGSSFCNGAHSSFQASALCDIKWRPHAQEAVARRSKDELSL